jgi:hypothetical protein
MLNNINNNNNNLYGCETWCLKNERMVFANKVGSKIFEPKGEREILKGWMNWHGPIEEFCPILL